jgi:hypothetical protein
MTGFVAQRLVGDGLRLIKSQIRVKWKLVTENVLFKRKEHIRKCGGTYR